MLYSFYLSSTWQLIDILAKHELDFEYSHPLDPYIDEKEKESIIKELNDPKYTLIKNGN